MSWHLPPQQNSAVSGLWSSRFGKRGTGRGDGCQGDLWQCEGRTAPSSVTEGWMHLEHTTICFSCLPGFNYLLCQSGVTGKEDDQRPLWWPCTWQFCYRRFGCAGPGSASPVFDDKREIRLQIILALLRFAGVTWYLHPKDEVMLKSDRKMCDRDSAFQYNILYKLKIIICIYLCWIVDMT